MRSSREPGYDFRAGVTFFWNFFGFRVFSEQLRILLHLALELVLLHRIFEREMRTLNPPCLSSRFVVELLLHTDHRSLSLTCKGIIKSIGCLGLESTLGKLKLRESWKRCRTDFFLCLNGLVGGFVLDTFLAHFSNALVDFNSPTNAHAEGKKEKLRRK